MPDSRPCKFSGTVLKNGSEILAFDNTRLALRIIGFVARKCISALQECKSLPRLKCSAAQRMFLVLLNFRYESAGKCHRKFLSSADDCFDNNVCTKGSKLLQLQPCKAKALPTLKEHDPITRTFAVGFQQFLGKNVFRSCCIRSGEQHFSIGYNTGEFLLDILKIIIKANLLVSFTGC